MPLDGTLRIDKLVGMAALGWSFLLGTSLLGMTTDLRMPVELATLDVSDGYTVEGAGLLSIDPPTATAQIAEYADGTPTASGGPLVYGDRIEARYNNVLVFQGIVQRVECRLDASMDAFRRGHDYIRQWTISLAGYTTVLLARTVEYGALPEESALVRVRRWFTVDASAVAASHVAQTAVLVPAIDAGSSTMLDLARAFTTATGLPLRAKGIDLPAGWDELQVIDTAVAWTDAPTLDVTAGLDDSEEWLTEVTFTQQAGTVLEPSGLTVRTGDTRFLSGIVVQTVSPDLLGTTFVLGVSVLGSTITRSVGARPLDVVDVLGAPRAIARIQQSFGSEYRASVEFGALVTLPIL